MAEKSSDRSHNDQEMADLFFRALFRLGIHVQDLEIWYGTRPASVPGSSGRPTLLFPTARPNQPRSR